MQYKTSQQCLSVQQLCSSSPEILCLADWPRRVEACHPWDIQAHLTVMRGTAEALLAPSLAAVFGASTTVGAQSRPIPDSSEAVLPYL